MIPIERGVGALLVGAMLSVTPHAAAGSPDRPEVHALLEVPYLPQTPELCGGAAVAMVLRYWGERGVFPQDFTSLVNTSEGGILTGALASAVRDRGWQALVVVPAADDTARTLVRSEIDRGRPLIALIEVGPATYHYVVIVGSTDREVVLHDPARAPFRVLLWADFDRAWTATGRWAMLVLPPDGFRPDDDLARAKPPAPDTVVVHAAPTACDALVERGVTMALAGERDGAEQVLVAANGLCPNDPAALRELAGLRFSQSRWTEARDLALSVVRLAPDDAYAWQLVATSQYLTGDTMGALEAWNHAGEPRVDTVDIHGAGRTRYPVVARTAGFQPRQVLTPEVLGRALRRLRDLPVASNVRMTYEPTAGGLARVDVFLDERKRAPAGWLALANLGTRALLLDELRVDLAGPLGAGDLASAAWRWTAARPRVALGLAFPSPRWLPGLVAFNGSWERQSYAVKLSPAVATLAREERRRVGLHLADWPTSWLRWQAGAALDRFRQYDDLNGNRFKSRGYFAVEGVLDARLAGDRVAFAASGGWWVPLAGTNRFATGELLAAWRSTPDPTRPVWSAVTEIEVASGGAPLAVWQGAGTGQGRSGLLRAHPLLRRDVLTGPVFGRAVTHGSIEHARPVAFVFAGRLSVAAFVDAARAWHRLNDPGASLLYVDAGFGVHLHGKGPGDAIRIDIADGLRGGGAMLSASWGRSWPR